MAGDARAAATIVALGEELERLHAPSTPSERLGARNLTLVSPDLTPEPSEPMSDAERPIFPPRSGPWSLPPRPHVRALTPWLVLVAILGAAIVVGIWG